MKIDIDFGQILGNVQMWKGIKRERAPFVLTKEFIRIIGKKDSQNYKKFVNICCTAYNVIRHHSYVIYSFFSMVSCNI